MCIAVSTAIWFLIALSKDYKTYIDFPVTYVNAPDDQVIINELPDRIAIEVSSHGFGLLSYSWFSSKTIAVDLSGLKTKTRGENTHQYVVTKDLVNRFSEQFDGAVVLHNDRIYPDTIHVLLSDTITKKVAVELDLDLSFQDQYNLSDDIQYFPTAVYIHGPRSVLDTMTMLKTQHIKKLGLNESASFTVGFALSNELKDVEFDQPEVLVKIPVDLFTERSQKVGVQALNVPDGYEVRLFPDSIEVQYLVGLKSYSTIDRHMFSAVVELPDTSELTNNMRLRVRLLETPEFVDVIDYEPKRIEPFIRHNQ